MKKPVISKIYLFSQLIAATMISYAQINNIPDNIPDRVDSWILSEKHTYTPDNLFEYIDGGAELYKSFGFTVTYSRKYMCENQPDIILDIFEMNNPEDAFGVFTFSAEQYDLSFGDGAQYGEGYLLFWKNRFFISIMTHPATPESSEAVKSLGRTLESLIRTSGSLPQIVHYMPEEGLVEGSIRYFHHPAWLNTHYFISDENIFLIDDQTEVALAKYGHSSDKNILLVVLYPREKLAEAGYLEFKKHYFNDHPETDFIRIEDHTYTGCIRKGKLIIAVFNASSEDESELLVNKVKELYK